MARINDQLIWNVTGQTLSMRFTLGFPTSATYQAFRSYMNDDAVPEFSGVAVLDPVNTLLNAAAGPGQPDPQNVPLASTAGIVTSKKYLLSQNALTQWVEPNEIGVGYLRNRHPLQVNYTTGATFQSTHFTAAVPDSWAADRSKLSDLSDTYQDFRCKWTIVYAGATYVIYTNFDLLRQPTTFSVDIDDLNARAPGLEDSLPTEYKNEDGRPLIEAAWRAVRAHLLAIGLDLNALRNNEAMDELVILRALRILAEGGWRPPNMDSVAYVALTQGNYDRMFEQHFMTLKDRLDYQFGPLSRNLVIPTPGVWRK